MPTTQSVVTPERFAQGRTWDDYLRYIASPENLAREAPGGGVHQDNAERFRKNMAEYTMKPEHVAALKALPRMKLLVIGEDWCPDVYRGAPVLARIAEVAGWEARFFQRDDNKDLMAEFLNRADGNAYESIPVAVLYTGRGFRYVGHWIERPRIAYDHYATLQAAFKKQPGESDDGLRTRMRQTYRDLQSSDHWAAWRHATVDEILAIARNAPA